ncbi:hypothetical protein OG339_16110 [Streptosporangium sp. NBC_01495]|uniref:hypothetical protein n=1 Tax=Streptosporangium sp. NBC_01495 TaxID=2903899 RepID=UPI002E33957D|nr:hypothetical protein [Streptosporangium sp. NBC_01495]
MGRPEGVVIGRVPGERQQAVRFAKGLGEPAKAVVAARCRQLQGSAPRPAQ